MAHFILEYSANLAHEKLALAQLFAKLHQTAAATGLFPLAGLRSRAHRLDEYHVANGDPRFGFVHLNFRIGPGRSENEKTQVFTVLRDILNEHLNELYQSQAVAISFEITELPADLRHNHNNLRQYLF